MDNNRKYNQQNALVAAASPLLSIATRLQHGKKPADFTKLHERLSHAIRSFEKQAHQAGYHSPIIVSARYLLCSLLDELINTAPWSKPNDWVNESLVNTFYPSTRDGERFFAILQEASQDKKAPSIDLIELGVICLSLGYQGIWRGTQHTDKLSQARDTLHNFIRHERVSQATALYFSSNEQPPPTKKVLLPPWWLCGIITLLILMGVFFAYHIKLDNIKTTVLTHVHDNITVITKSSQAHTTRKAHE